ncbi:PaaI family thioesterase [Acidicapsa ligni]|uniref:PaaI family thioesterase n=1 Tax=Acidicapsa ligni TaxID=542300 RepID=UPI0021DFB8D4|nr:PaaI family thioesterase [Acidicapsa ligni]
MPLPTPENGPMQAGSEITETTITETAITETTSTETTWSSEQNPEQQNIEPLFHGAQNHCFGCGPGNSVGLQLKFSTLPDETVICSTSISDSYEGPPGYLHGGIIATLLDEAMSKANRARGVTAMTRQMQVEYLRPVASNGLIQIEGRVTRSEGRKHWTTAQILNAGGTILAHATGLFIAISR